MAAKMAAKITIHHLLLLLYAYLEPVVQNIASLTSSRRPQLVKKKMPATEVNTLLFLVEKI